MERITRIVPLLVASSGLALAACGHTSHQPATDAANTAANTGANTDTPPAAQALAAEADQALVTAREQDLAQREAALKQQQQDIQDEIARHDAVVASTQAQAAKNASPSTSPKSTGIEPPPVVSHQPRPSATLASNNSPQSGTSSGMVRQSRFTVPAGTALEIELTAGVNTKKAHVGDTVSGRLRSPIMVGDTYAVEAGSQITGTVTEVVSGSDKIGGVPTLGLTFDSLVAENGSRVPINAKFVQQGTSDTAQDTAKILGGAAAGAVIGHQVNNSNKGTIIGGIIGGAAGTAAAKNTGGEVRLPAGTVVNVTTDSSFQVER
jgi:hypothetical protein